MSDATRELDRIADSFFDVVPDLLCGPNCGRSCNGKAREVWDWLRAALDGPGE